MSGKNNSALPVRYLLTISLYLIPLLLPAAYSPAQTVRENDADLDRIDIVEHLGDTIPLDLHFTDEYGQPVTLGKYFEPDKPVILILAYYTCPRLCNLVLNGTADAVKQMEWIPGKKFNMVTVSIDPTETDLVAKAKKDNYLKYIDKKGMTENAWHFLTGEASQSKALADAIGFKYFFDEKRGEYAHTAAIYIITGDGVISRYFYGIKFDASQVKLGLLEASEGKIGSTVDRVILYCFHYDPESKGYVLFARNVMMLGGAVTLLALILVVGGLWFKEKIKHRVSKNNKSDLKETVEN